MTSATVERVAGNPRRRADLARLSNRRTGRVACVIVSTERLGWPKIFGARQHADEPSATCHLQPESYREALCGYPWESLVAVPGDPAWSDLHPDLRCDDCASAAGLADEDPTGKVYRYSWADRP
jgi:hypothetical protein